MSLLVPENRAFPDSDDLLGEALTALSRSGSPAARDVLVALAVPSDEIHWWRDVPTGPLGTASWVVEDQLRSAARQMLLAAALATRARAGYYGARHRLPAAASLDGVLVGAVPGGRRLTAFVPVATGRPLALRLHQALYAVREAIDYRRATGGMDAFDGAVEAGVSHELTEALVALVRGTEGARVAVDWAPAAGVPEGGATPAEPVEFSPGDLPVLREAGARYLREEPSMPVRITGAVVRMRRSAARGEGTVRLRVIAGCRGPARAHDPGRGVVPDRGTGPSRRTAGPGAREAGEPGRVPAAHRRRRDRTRAGRRGGAGPADEVAPGDRGDHGLLRGGLRRGLEVSVSRGAPRARYDPSQWPRQQQTDRAAPSGRRNRCPTSV